MKNIKPFYLYLIAAVLTIAGNYIVKRDSLFYYPYGIICISIVSLALYKQFKTR
ncbi:hypothetical protein [Flavobacterium sp.]|uniref:hypothetical protein n=1 Tax=Flavobacterium sp. TaxID=239 RepID=UPI002B4B71E8|nr:hypothetical protein [Flavobacterium sp.]HLP63956.1 hypothetical protein [Flavobacterium sp.]